MRNLHFFVYLWFMLCTACVTERKQILKSYKQFTLEEQAIADSMILYALDHEALYTLATDIKPMSSVKFFRVPVLAKNLHQKDTALFALEKLYTVINKLNTKEHVFVLAPFERIDSIYRNMEVYVFNRKSLDQLLRDKQAFYFTWGMMPGTNPATILTATEYEQKYNRWQSYGYLFGYPDHAVDFFVQAGKRQDSTGKFVARDFFNMPVYVGKQGYFTYAIPKGYKTTEVDSSIYKRAEIVLEKYKSLRSTAEKEGKKVSGVKLWARIVK